jgi:dolichyl-phosphate-mannose-protein mannosyltransferase
MKAPRWSPFPSASEPTAASPLPLQGWLEPHSRWLVGLGLIWLVSLGLRFWGLGRFNTLVFDEVYYAKFAHHYLAWTHFFDGHPPLSKYIIALGMKLGNAIPIGEDQINASVGSLHTTWSYRWLNALTGSFIPLAIASLAYQLTRRPSYALWAGLLASLDGLFLVESRYALNNVYLVLFSLLGWIFCFYGLAARGARTLWLVLAGCGFAASASVKWNGLWFLLGFYALWAIASGLQFWRHRVSPPPPDPVVQFHRPESPFDPLRRLARLRPVEVALYFMVVPAVFYWLQWLPHLQLNPEFNFFQVQEKIWSYHKNLTAPHAYCSPWYSWLVMLRPVAYFYQQTAPGAPLRYGTDAPSPGIANPVIYDVHAMGNPVLWWLSTAAIGLTLVGFMLRSQLALYIAISRRTRLPKLRSVRLPSATTTETGLACFLTVNYLTQLGPWMPVTRCTFLYHYMGASVFAMMALAAVLEHWFNFSNLYRRSLAIALLGLMILAFIFWMPIYLGIPLDSAGFAKRMWFRSWI